MPIAAKTISYWEAVRACASWRHAGTLSISTAITTVLAATIGIAATATAQAAAFTASNQAELLQAINDANNSADASSTITLTAGFSVSAASLPPVMKQLTLNTGSHLLTSTGDATWNVDAGAILTIEGATAVNAGRLIKAGTGTVVLDGVNGDQGSSIEVSSGLLRIEGGSQLSAGLNASWSAVRVAGGTMVLSGTGTKVTANPGAASSNIGGINGRMIIADGAEFVTPSGTIVATTSAETGTLTVTGRNSLFNGAALSVTAGQGAIGVNDRGEIRTTGVGIGGLGSGLYNGGRGTVVVSDAGSIWNNSGAFRLYNGTLGILAGGRMTTATFHAAAATNAGSMSANILVDGEGSEIATTGTGPNDFQIAGGNISGARSGTLTIANGGKVTVGAGTGTISMASVAAGHAVLNIGGAEGAAAANAGTLDARRIQFGPGTGVINFNHTNSNFGFDVELASGTGSSVINQLGSGKTILTSNQLAFTGQSNVLAGTLAVNGILGGTMDVRGGRLQGIGKVGSTTNHLGGVIAPGNSIGTLTIGGDYTSNGGGLEIEAELGDDSSNTDLLLITGNSILGTGPTQVRVINVGGLGAETTGDGIRIVEVQGAISDAGAFVLSGPAIGGARRYNLFQNDLTGTLDDGNWYLRSAGLAPTVPVYDNYPQVLLGMVALPTLEQRVGQRVRNAVAGDPASSDTAIWTRIEGAHGHVEASASTTGVSYDSNTALVQAGFDAELASNATGSLVGGITAQFSQADANLYSSLGDGSNTTVSRGIGATLTWYGANGFYVDAQAQAAALRSDLYAAGVGRFGNDIHGGGYALSLEAGQKVALGNEWSLTPQAQLAYSSIDFGAFTDPFGANVSLRQGDSLKGRLGVAANYDNDAGGGHVYGIANLTYEFLDGTSVAVSGIDLAFEPQRFGGELGLGGTYKWADGKYALHGEALAATSFEGGYGFKGTIGFSAGL